MDVQPYPSPEELDDAALDAAATALVAAGTAAGRTVAAAESLTAGLVCATIARVPGASNVLRGGVVVYATDLKATLAGVPERVLVDVGAVAPETAAALARGAAERCGADVGLGLTGVAGPTAQEGKPVGTVFVGVHTRGGSTVHALAAHGDRTAIRNAATLAALRLGAAELSRRELFRTPRR